MDEHFFESCRAVSHRDRSWGCMCGISGTAALRLPYRHQRSLLGTDETLVLVRGKSHKEAADAAILGVVKIAERIQQLGLDLALHKSENMCSRGPQGAPLLGSHITVK